jgi:hypothetical protein
MNKLQNQIFQSDREAQNLDWGNIEEILAELKKLLHPIGSLK